MAPFNPALQNLNDPSYTRDSRGADTPRTPAPEGQAQNQILPKGVDTPDRSAEYEGKSAAYGLEAQGVAATAEGAAEKGLGDLFAGVAGLGDFLFKGADTLIRKDIERQVYDTANREREDYTKKLEGYLAGTGKKSIFDANASMDGAEDQVPGELEGLSDNLGQLKSAVDAGKISNTYYTGRLLAAAKDLRARYPEYREYIDQQFSQVTGMNPANARVNALTQDINRAMTSQASTQNKMMAEVMKRNGQTGYNNVNSVQAIQKIRSGEWTSMQDVATWAYPIDAKEATTTAKLRDVQLYKGERDVVQGKANDAAFSVLAKNADDMVAGIMSQFEVKDPQELLLKLKQDQPQKWWQDRAAELTFARNTYRDQMFQVFTAGGTNSLAAKMNMKPGEVRAYIDEFGTKKIDDIITAVKDKDANGVYGGVNRIKAAVDESVEFMISQPKIRDFALAGAASKQLFGDNSTLAREFIERAVQKNFQGRYSAALDAHSNWLSLGANKKDGPVPSFNETFEELKQKPGALTKSNASKLIDKVTDIANPKVSDEEKYSLAVSAFGPKNAGFLRQVTTASGDGQWGVFNKWTADGIAKEVKRLDAKYPGIWKQYTDWTTKTMTQDLLQSDFQVLNNMNKESNFEVKWKASDNGIREIQFIPRVQPDDGTNRLLQQHIAGGRLPQQNDYKALENRFNSALRRYSVIAKENGGDADAFILRSLYDNGLLSQGLMSDKILEAIKSSRIKTEMKNNAGR